LHCLALRGVGVGSIRTAFKKLRERNMSMKNSMFNTVWRYLPSAFAQAPTVVALEETIVGNITVAKNDAVGESNPGPLLGARQAERLEFNFRRTGFPSMSRARMEWWECHGHPGGEGIKLRARYLRAGQQNQTLSPRSSAVGALGNAECWGHSLAPPAPATTPSF